MLKLAPQDRPLFVALMAVALTLLLMWGTSASPQRQPAKDHAHQNQQGDTPLGDFWNWITKDSISFFTAVLALFTGVTVFYNGRQIRLSRDEFNATHRPRIYIHYLETGYSSDFEEEGVDPDNGPQIEVLLHFVNVGDASAHIVEICARITNNPEPGMIMGPNRILKSATLASGEGGSHWITSNLYYPTAGQQVPRPSCVGYIRYQDSSRRNRRVGFCRTFNPETDRWENTGYPGLEYEF
jgi:hypothetical protein